MFTHRTAVSWAICLLSLVTLAGCFGKPMKIKATDAASEGKQSDGTGVGGGEAGPGDGPAIADSKIPTDGPSSNGGAGGKSGIGDGSVGGNPSDAIGPDVVVDTVADLPATADASGGMDALSATGGAGGTGGTSGTGGVIGTDVGPGAVDVRPEAGDAPGADVQPGSPVGGSGGTGGNTTSGGMTSTGGTTTTGGTPATGGTATRGGALATGGTATTGGAPATGGTTTTGGASPTGGTTGSGGTTGLKTAGASCGATGECQTGLTCLDGVCCTQSTCPACQNCGATGTCSITVSSADDTTGTTCTGTNTCGAAGTCKKKSGETCLAAGDCASGKCVDSLDGTSKICCASTCSTCQGCKSDGSACARKNAGAPDSTCGTAANCQTGNCNSAGTCEQIVAGTTCGTNLYCTGSGQCAPKLFEGLGVLPPDYTDSSYANGVSSDGSTVVGEVDGEAGEVTSAFKWTKSTGMTLLPGPNTVALAISSASVVGSATGQWAISWTGTTENDLFNYQGNNTYPSVARAVSANGSTIVGSGNGVNGTKAVRWVATSSYTAQLLHPETAYSYSEAFGVSSDGSIIVGNTSAGAFRWTSTSGLVLLPGGTTAGANAISADGTVVVGGNSSGSAVRWVGSASASPLGSTQAQAMAVNRDGTVIVGFTGSTTTDAFVWDTTNGMRSLATVLTNAGADVSAWTLNQATGVSSDGKVIVGNGSHNGTYEAWIARLP